MRKALLIAALLMAALGIWIGTAPQSGFLWITQDEVAHIATQNILPDALDRFRTDMGRYPTTEEGLTSIVRAPVGTENMWRGPYIEAVHGSVMLDPWNRPYQYHLPGQHNPTRYDLWSLGGDDRTSSDDIGNWPRWPREMLYFLAASFVLAAAGVYWRRITGCIKRTK